ncbi:MAG: hypothetical protein AAGJ46_11755 [Planctomycetota bacterium]
MSDFKDEVEAEGASLWLKTFGVACFGAFSHYGADDGGSGIVGMSVAALIGGFVGWSLAMKDLAHRLLSEEKPMPAWLHVLYCRHALSLALWTVIATAILLLIFFLISLDDLGIV